MDCRFLFLLDFAVCMIARSCSATFVYVELHDSCSYSATFGYVELHDSCSCSATFGYAELHDSCSCSGNFSNIKCLFNVPAYLNVAI